MQKKPKLCTSAMTVASNCNMLYLQLCRYTFIFASNCDIAISAGKYDIVISTCKCNDRHYSTRLKGTAGVVALSYLIEVSHSLNDHLTKTSYADSKWECCCMKCFLQKSHSCPSAVNILPCFFLYNLNLLGVCFLSFTNDILFREN